ncbi:hypothetical protein Poly51_59470 [Rubripirellula tenax]|uniref:Uncharacterized protein n=1 Tax=Rubripirellula tenax TaxID=2528015 RepID=A0A5C6E747_9BACT|nr:hypothetical protein [Rubripirellula tenax]TWU42924.1 hypothetical protein Poly51_63500 [Rubripirellula tenax]TWU44678.1 hypothetical protein Poly51_59470 [Rubripirellula tenax]
MSARGSLVSNPSKRPKLISESKRYIPLLWLGMLSLEDIDNDDCGAFEIDRVTAIERAERNLPFLTAVFPNLPFEDSARSLLDRLRKLRSDNIGIDITELVEPDPPNPGLQDALVAIAAQNHKYSLSIPARNVENPATGDMIKVKAQKIASTQDMLLRVCWLTPHELDEFDDEELRDIVSGYIWK